MRDEAGPAEDVGDANDRGEAADRVLVARLRTGDDSAVAELYERWMPLLLEEARRRRVQPALRQEAVDDVIARVVLSLRKPGARVPRSLGAWLTVALRRHVLNMQRAERRSAAHRSDTDVETVPAPATEESSSSVAMATVWDRALARLDERERELVGFLGDHVPQRHIAEWTGRSHDAIRSAAKRLRAKLRVMVRELAAELPPDERAQVERRLARIGTPRVDVRQGHASRREP